MGVITDLIEGSDVRRTMEGWFVTRTIYVEELSGDGQEKIKNAITSTIGIPALGDVHPVYPLTYLKEISPKIIDSNIVVLSLEYKPNPYTGDEYEMSADAVPVESNTDIDGNDIWVEYTYPADYPDEKYAGLTDVQGVMYNRLVPDKVFTVRKRMLITGSGLLSLIDNYQNHVNSTGWTIDSSAPAGSWLCTEIKGRNDRVNGGYLVSITFRKRQSFVRDNVTYPGWTDTWIYIDPGTGKPPPPDTWGENTIKMKMNYPEANFNTLISSM